MSQEERAVRSGGDVWRRLLARALASSKGGQSYAPDPAITGRMAFQLVTYAGIKAARGRLLQSRFGTSAGAVLIGRRVRITHPQMIHCGRGFVVEDDAELHGLCRSGLVFGDNVTIGRGAQIRPSGYYGRAVGQGLKVGNNSNIGPLAYIGASGGVELGSDVLMGPRVTVLSEEHVFDDGTATIKSQGVRGMSTVVADDVWIGAHAVILGGSRVGSGSIIAAGSVVRGVVPANTVVAGAPARVVKERPR